MAPDDSQEYHLVSKSRVLDRHLVLRVASGRPSWVAIIHEQIDSVITSERRITGHRIMYCRCRERRRSLPGTAASHRWPLEPLNVHSGRWQSSRRQYKGLEYSRIVKFYIRKVAKGRSRSEPPERRDKTRWTRKHTLVVGEVHLPDTLSWE